MLSGGNFSAAPPPSHDYPWMIRDELLATRVILPYGQPLSDPEPARILQGSTSAVDPSMAEGDRKEPAPRLRPAPQVLASIAPSMGQRRTARLLVSACWPSLPSHGHSPLSSCQRSARSCLLLQQHYLSATALLQFSCWSVFNLRQRAL